jgi:hypothetical protein
MLREDDFERGQAHTFENRSFCIQCRPLATLPPPAPPPTTPKPFKHVSSTRIPRPPSGHMTPPGEMPLPPAPSAPASRGSLVAGVVIAVIVVLGAGFAMMSGGNKGSRGGDGMDVRVVDRDPKPYQPQGRGPGPDVSPPPVTPTNEDPAKKAYSKAVEFRQFNPNDLVGQFKAFDEVIQLYGTSGVADIARREIMAIRKRFTDELGQVSEQARIPMGSEEFQAVIDLWTRAKSRYGHAEWTGPADDKIREANDMAASRFGTLRAKAAEARKLGDANEVKKQRDRVTRWGLPGYVDEFDKALAEVTPDKPGKPTPPSSKEADVYGGAWKEVIALATRREYDAALALLQKTSDALKEKDVKAEAARDLEDLALACRAGTEGRALLSKIAKGQKLSISYVDDAWARAGVEGTVSCADGQRVEIKRGEEAVVVLVGEIGAATAAELFRGRATKLPTDARAAALLCMIEGDTEAAKKIAVNPALPEKYAGVAAEAAEGLKAVPPKEDEARKVFVEAEGSYFDPLRTADAVKLYKSLLAEFGATAFVRRNKGAITGRTEGGKEYVLSSADMSATGFFKLGKHNGVEGWMSTKDQEMAQLKDNYVQFDFSALADTDYRLWVNVGGCCQEVLTFYVQGTDLSAPNPKKLSETIAVPIGGELAGGVKMPYLSLKKKHSDHTGPKEPDKWEWVPVPLPKYAAAGVKSVRLLTIQKGFSVAGAVISALRTGPPKEKELAEMERAKAETPGYLASRSSGPAGGILREWWLDIQGGDVSNLTSNPSYPDKPSGSKVEDKFAAPVDWADNYGTRMRGWVHPPVTGNYIFWITTDDQGELWLSADDTPERKQRIASCPSYAGPTEWQKHAQQQSAPIALVAGKRYYVEALHKEGVGGDHVAVGWQLPDGKQERPIPGNRLSPVKKK